MKDPAFLFYPNDYIGGTMGMTFEEKGAYIELLMLQFNRGHMTSHMIGQTVGQLWDKIKDKFTIDEQGLYYNVRLDVEKDKRKSFTDSRKNNLKGVNGYSKKSGHITGHMTSHMENENKDIKNTKLFNKVISENSILLPDGFEELIMEWLKYKSEKKQSYKETGLKNLIKSFIRDAKGNKDFARIILDHSTSNNYSGLYPPKNSKFTDNDIPWKKDFRVYEKECRNGYKEFMENPEKIETQQRLNPNIDIKLTIEKGFKNYWIKEIGWKNKKENEGDEIDWEQTIINSITNPMNRVYITNTKER